MYITSVTQNPVTQLLFSAVIVYQITQIKPKTGFMEGKSSGQQDRDRWSRGRHDQYPEMIADLYSDMLSSMKCLELWQDQIRTNDNNFLENFIKNFFCWGSLHLKFTFPKIKMNFNLLVLVLFSLLQEGQYKFLFEDLSPSFVPYRLLPTLRLLAQWSPGVRVL